MGSAFDDGESVMDEMDLDTFAESISYRHGTATAIDVSGIWTDGDSLVSQPGTAATLDVLRSDFTVIPQPNDAYTRNGKTYSQIGPVVFTAGNWMRIDLRYVGPVVVLEP